MYSFYTAYCTYCSLCTVRACLPACIHVCMDAWMHVQITPSMYYVRRSLLPGMVRDPSYHVEVEHKVAISGASYSPPWRPPRATRHFPANRSKTFGPRRSHQRSPRVLAEVPWLHSMTTLGFCGGRDHCTSLSLSTAPASGRSNLLHAPSTMAYHGSSMAWASRNLAKGDPLSMCGSPAWPPPLRHGSVGECTSLTSIFA